MPRIAGFRYDRIMTATPYDEVAYPSLLFSQSSPDRLAVLARLHGIAAAPPETARVLHVGGGDGLDVIALAAAYPGGTFVNFDLAEAPVERGRRWSAAAGLGNVRHLVLDIMEAAERLDGRFDYIVVHGVYAWVPDAVRAAIMPLLQRLLTPTGIAFVSYNALPGGYGRMAVRDMMLHHVGHIADPVARIAAAKALLRQFVTPGPDEAPITATMRREAEVALTYADGLLFHDQLNGCYAPQSLSQVVQAAETAGLRYLGEARGDGVDQGFVDPERGGIGDTDLVRYLQARDYRSGRYFRTSLFVPAELPFTRVLDSDAAAGMSVASRAQPGGDGSFRMGQATLGVADPRQATMLTGLIARGGGWYPVDTVAADAGDRAALCRWAVTGFVDLHAAAAPFTLIVGERPTASPLARLQAAEGQSRIAALDHRLIALDDADERALLQRLDGSATHADIASFWQATRRSRQVSLDTVLGGFAARRLLLAP